MKLASMTTADLHREVSRRERMTRALNRRRERVLSQIKRIDQEIALAGGTTNGHVPRTRPKNDLQLIDALAKLLKGNPLSVTEAAEQVKKRGYVSHSPNFRTMVNAALLNKRRFKRISRGVYETR